MIAPSFPPNPFCLPEAERRAYFVAEVAAAHRHLRNMERARPSESSDLARIRELIQDLAIESDFRLEDLDLCRGSLTANAVLVPA